MKTLKLITLVGIMMLFTSNLMNAQVSINVNLGMQPNWGPVGYSSVNYYYLPDIQSYYDVRASQFIYLNGGHWVRSGHLPNHYRNYDLHQGYKVVLNDYHGSKPYTNYKYDKVKYHKGYKGKPQKSIRDSHDHHEDHGKNGKNDHKGNNGNNGHGNKKH